MFRTIDFDFDYSHAESRGVEVDVDESLDLDRINDLPTYRDLQDLEFPCLYECGEAWYRDMWRSRREYVRVLANAYVLYHETRAIRLSEMGLEAYVPPEDAPPSVHALFANPTAPILHSTIERAVCDAMVSDVMM